MNTLSVSTPAKRRKWTDEDIHREALKYQTRSDFERQDLGAYSAALRRGIMDQVCQHMTPLRSNWSNDQLLIEARKYNTKADFEKGSSSAYQLTRQRGIHDQACAHMEGNTRWSLDQLKVEASRYTTRKEFERGSLNAYYAAQRRGVLDEVCAHMMRAPFGTDNDSIYIWRVAGTNVFKVGITSHILGRLRMFHVADLAQVTPEHVFQARTIGRASEVETKLLKIGTPYKFQQKFAGHTEFRVWSEKELTQALEVAASHSLLN